MTAGEKTSVRSSVGITEVVGDLDTKIWEEILQQKCGAQVTNVDGKSMLIQLSSYQGRQPCLRTLLTLS